MYRKFKNIWRQDPLIVAHYPLNLDGSKYTDISGNARHLNSAYSTPTSMPGREGKKTVKFTNGDSASQYYMKTSPGTAFVWSAGTQLSVAFWMYNDKTVSETTSSNWRFLQKDASASGGANGNWLITANNYTGPIGATNLMGFGYTNSTNTTSYGSYQNSIPQLISKNRWYHFVYTYTFPTTSDATLPKLYVNGVQVSMGAWNTTPNGTVITSSTDPLYVGADSYTSSHHSDNRGCTARIEDLILAKRAWTSEEVSNLYRSYMRRPSSWQDATTPPPPPTIDVYTDAFVRGSIDIITDDFEWYPYYSSYTPSQTLIADSFEWWPTVTTMAYVDGGPIPISQSTDAFVEGFGGTISISTEAFVYGHISLSHYSNAFMDAFAYASASISTYAYILPYTTISQSSNAYILPAITLSTYEDAYVYGALLINSSSPAFLHGSDEVAVYVGAIVDTSTSISISSGSFIYGVLTSQTYTDAFVLGYDTISTAISGSIFGKEIISTNINAFIEPKDTPIIKSKAYIHGYDVFTIGISAYAGGAIPISYGELAYVYGDTEIQTSINAHLHIVDYANIFTIGHAHGYIEISGLIPAHLHDFDEISISSPAYVYPISTGSTSINAAISDVTDERSTNIPAFINGILGVTGVGITGFLHGIDTGVISTNAYVDTSTTISTNSNAYMWPWETGHVHTIPAYLSVDNYTSSGYTGFSHFGALVLTDASYNRVVTLRSEYYVGTGAITFNTYLCNGSGSEVSNIIAITDSTWAGQVKIMRGATPIVLTDNWGSSSVIISSMSNDTASFVPIVVTPSIGITGHVEIPIYISYTNII